MSRSVLAKIGWVIKEAIAPAFCVQCGEAGGWLCSVCAEQILFVREQTCYRCGKISDDGKTCQRCRPKTDLNGVMVATHYEAGSVREMIHKLKYDGITELAEILGWIGYQGLANKKWDGWVVIPVPLHSSRLAKRGFNQSELLGRQVVKYIKIDGLVNGLKRVRSTTAQVELTGSDRRSNVYQAFKSMIDLRGKRVLLIDDVMTTGATLDDCARACKDAGAKSVWGVVIARG